MIVGTRIEETRDAAIKTLGTLAVPAGRPPFPARSLGGPLVLHYASKRSSVIWGPDDCDVMFEGRVFAHIFRTARVGGYRRRQLIKRQPSMHRPLGSSSSEPAYAAE
jgi:hypothetical protein